jgi:hypothetical protein
MPPGESNKKSIGAEDYSSTAEHRNSAKSWSYTARTNDSGF